MTTTDTSLDWPEDAGIVMLRALAPVLGGEDLRTLVLAELAKIHHDLQLVRALVITRQHNSLGFMSVEAAKVQDDLIRTERADRYRHAQEGVKTTGVTPAPGSVAAYSLLAEWAAVLADIEHRATAKLERLGICHRVSRPAGDHDSDEARYRRVVELVAVTTREPFLRPLHHTLVDLHTRVTRCVDGNQVKAMPDPCPWCGHDTLVADLIAGVIRCDRDRHTGELEPCICSDSYCGCKTGAHTRHEWHRDHKPHKATSWQGLRRAINAAGAGE